MSELEVTEEELTLKHKKERKDLQGNYNCIALVCNILLVYFHSYIHVLAQAICIKSITISIRSDRGIMQYIL